VCGKAICDACGGFCRAGLNAFRYYLQVKTEAVVRALRPGYEEDQSAQELLDACFPPNIDLGEAFQQRYFRSYDMLSFCSLPSGMDFLSFVLLSLS
jgi:hypothetical protein